MTKEDKRSRILPALDLAIQEAERRGVISDLDIWITLRCLRVRLQNLVDSYKQF